MLRHMKAHLKDTTASGQTYSCSICDKVFSRADTRKRHEAAHSYSLTCEVCAPSNMPQIQDSGLWILWQHVWSNRILHGNSGWW
jgi:uncharacterized Zn-finger protein